MTERLLLQFLQNTSPRIGLSAQSAASSQNCKSEAAFATSRYSTLRSITSIVAAISSRSRLMMTSRLTVFFESFQSNVERAMPCRS
jgi:hypothetical protein